MPKLHIVLYKENPERPFSESIAALNPLPCGVRLTIAGASPAEKAFFFRKGIPGIHASDIKAVSFGSDFQLDDAGRLLEADHDSDFILLVSNAVALSAKALRRCLDMLAASSHIKGVNPLFISGDANACVTHLGTVADSFSRLHFLYEGIAYGNALAEKQRLFQIARPEAFLLKAEAFRACHGFPKSGLFPFVNFCIHMTQQYGPCFATAPCARAVWQPDLSALADMETWNSLVMRGKIPPNLLQPDYHSHVLDDGLQPGVTAWLYPCVKGLESVSTPWLAWRRNPAPETLLRWLDSLAPASLPKAIKLVRSLPSLLPGQWRYYKMLAEKMTQFARSQRLEQLENCIAEWKKRERSFRYGQLAPGMKMLFRAGIYNASLDQCPGSYDAWLELSRPAAPLQPGAEWPEIAVAMPVYNPNPDFLRQAIDSVLNQTYRNWTLCLADDASTNPETAALLKQYARDDPRIKVMFRKRNGHICAATNSAIVMAKAPFIAFMDHDDLLAKDALAQVASAAAENPDLALIYTDSDHVDEHNIRRSPLFKQDFNRELHGGCHLAVYGRHILHKAGMLRPGTEGSQDQDLFLRVTELCQPCQIKHIPRILYHWRIHAQSTAGSLASKPYVIAATQKTLYDKAMRLGMRAAIVPTEINNRFLTAYETDSSLSCAIVILAAENRISASLGACVENIAKNFAARIYWQPLATQAARGALRGSRVVNLDFAGESWPLACDNACVQCSEDLVLFLSSRLDPLPDCHPEQLIMVANAPHAGIIGSMLWHDGVLWNGGFFPDKDGSVFPLLAGMDKKGLVHANWCDFILPHAVVAPAWPCMAARRQLLADAGGFSAWMGEWAHLDLCLRLAQMGFDNAVSTWGQWRIKELPEQDTGEEESFYEQWRETLRHNGLRNPNLERGPDNNWKLVMNGR